MTETFVQRHIGPDEKDVREMLGQLGLGSLDELTDKTVPAAIRLRDPLKLGPPRSEMDVLAEMREVASKNKVVRSFIGQGYYDTFVPPVIQRNILENPGWYTQYTPYQAEISQGRLEALLNFQTIVADLTALPLANSSLLDEATAAAEAMAMCRSIVTDPAKKVFFIADDCHPQTIVVVQTRARSMGIECLIGNPTEIAGGQRPPVFGILLQYPTTDGRIVDYTDIIESAHKNGALVVFATDLLALTLIKPPGEFGADIAVGSAQRFGVPMGFGGPHAAFMATKTEHARKMPGRIVGVSKDTHGKPALRLALQTREQHIRREKATSNICTAQVLLAVMASMYAVWHGPEGLKRIARRVHELTMTLADGLRAAGHEVESHGVFDTLRIRPKAPWSKNELFNFRYFDDGSIGISLDETTTLQDVHNLLRHVGASASPGSNRQSKIENRKSNFLTHPVFNTHHAEHEMLRYIKKLESRDLSLTHSMIPLGSCTMKLNATAEMLPVTWPEFGRIHPFAPPEQAKGYQELFERLEKWLAEITGFAAVSLQPNAGSQGEYAGLLAIRGYHESRGDSRRNICLIPDSAHGTNPASAVIAGMKVVAVRCDAQGNIEISNLKSLCEQHAADLACLMVTYPSTHGVFEESIKEICDIVHRNGGQVYMDGANMNAQVGLTSPGAIGADVCHLNLHKTFCIPHGGGGPGMGPICVAKHLAPFVPSDPLKAHGSTRLSSSQAAVGPVSAANYGSASILVIPYIYIALMGGPGLTRATQVAILNANYMAKKLESHYPVLFRGKNGFCAHEFILDCREFERTANVKVEDIAKRLIDYGFHAPTMSWPVPGTLMIEPTESEPKEELDRFCEALIRIREEIRRIESGEIDKVDNVLKGAPHTAAAATGDDWPHKYGREEAAFPAAWVREHKFWPAVARIDNPYGDRNLVCACPPVEAYSS